MRVFREMPAGWDELAEHMTGTGDLGWLFWSVSQMTENAAWIERIWSGRLVRYDWVEECLKLSEPFLGRDEALRLLRPKGNATM